MGVVGDTAEGRAGRRATLRACDVGVRGAEPRHLRRDGMLATPATRNPPGPRLSTDIGWAPVGLHRGPDWRAVGVEPVALHGQPSSNGTGTKTCSAVLRTLQHHGGGHETAEARQVVKWPGLAARRVSSPLSSSVSARPAVPRDGRAPGLAELRLSAAFVGQLDGKQQ